MENDSLCNGSGMRNKFFSMGPSGFREMRLEVDLGRVRLIEACGFPVSRDSDGAKQNAASGYR